MRLAIHQPQFLPYLGFFDKVARCDAFVVMDDVQFLERGHQHRNEIKMQTGKQWLTVPVVQKRGQSIDAVKIDGATWRRKHWAALESNYRRAPHWAELAPSLQPLFLEGKHETLLALDMDLLKWAMTLLNVDLPTRATSELAPAGERTERLVNICKAMGADVYLSGAGGREYMELALFEAAGIRVEFQSYACPEYPQMFPALGFIANLAVVDALFNVGAHGTRALVGR